MTKSAVTFHQVLAQYFRVVLEISNVPVALVISGGRGTPHLHAYRQTSFVHH